MRVPALAFLNMADVLVFARPGRSNAEGAFATCHCLTLPSSDPGYYFWRDRRSGEITRRSEWFVTKSPHVTIGQRSIKYMISFSVPRFCDQSLDRSPKERFYRGAGSPPWLAKLDTVVHELYHIDPALAGIRRIEREDGTFSASCHGPDFFQQVAEMVQTYLDSRPSPDAYDFLNDDFSALEERFGGVVSTAFRTFPVPAALHRAARGAVAVRGGSGGRSRRNIETASPRDSLHRRRPAHPSVCEDVVATSHQEGRVPRRVIRCGAETATVFSAKSPSSAPGTRFRDFTDCRCHARPCGAPR